MGFRRRSSAAIKPGASAGSPPVITQSRPTLAHRGSAINTKSVNISVDVTSSRPMARQKKAKAEVGEARKENQTGRGREAASTAAVTAAAAAAHRHRYRHHSKKVSARTSRRKSLSFHLLRGGISALISRPLPSSRTVLGKLKNLRPVFDSERVLVLGVEPMHIMLKRGRFTYQACHVTFLR